MSAWAGSPPRMCTWRRRPGKDVLACFGPVPASRRAREAVRRLNDWYRLRDCSQAQPMSFADQGELFPIARAAGCLRYEIGTCLGPCAGGCTRGNYTAQVRAVRAFLEGSDATPVNTLRGQMEAAAAAQQFEHAATLRDRCEALDWLREQLDRVRRAETEHSFVYRSPGPARHERWYVIHHGQVRAVLAQPRTEKAKRTASDTLEQVYGAKSWTQAAAAEAMDVVMLVASWFRRHPENALGPSCPRGSSPRCVKRLPAQTPVTSTTMQDTLSREPESSASWPRPSAHSCTSGCSMMNLSIFSSETTPVRPSVQSSEAVAGLQIGTTLTSGPSPTSLLPRYFHRTLRKRWSRASSAEMVLASTRAWASE